MWLSSKCPLRLRLKAATFCIVVMYIVTFLIILPALCRDLVFSIYRSRAWTTSTLQENIVKTNARAVLDAETYIHTLPHMPSVQLITNQPSSTEFINISIAVVTVRRTLSTESLGYLTRTIATLDRLAKDSSFSARLFACNVNAGPSTHEEANRLRKNFLIIDRFPNGSATAAIMNPFEKEKQDYVFCIGQALRSDPPFVLMVEDDAVARNDLFHVLKFILSLETATFSSRRMSYLKMYYPERWQGYAFDIRSLLELSSLFILGCTSRLALLAKCSQRHNFCMLLRSNLGSTVSIGLFFVLVSVSIGRQHLLELRRATPSLYTLTAAPACCSPAILYSAEYARSMAHHLSTNVQCSHLLPLDVAMDNYAHATKQLGHLVEPNLFRHIGLISTMKGYSRALEDFLI